MISDEALDESSDLRLEAIDALPPATGLCGREVVVLLGRDELPSLWWCGRTLSRMPCKPVMVGVRVSGYDGEKRSGRRERERSDETLRVCWEKSAAREAWKRATRGAVMQRRAFRVHFAVTVQSGSAFLSY